MWLVVYAVGTAYYAVKVGVELEAGSRGAAVFHMTLLLACVYMTWDEILKQGRSTDG